MTKTGFSINILDLKTPDLMGEALRAYVFPGEGVGCYATFDVRSDFRELPSGSPEYERLARKVFDGSEDYCKEVVLPQGNAYAGPNGLSVFWFWDGDGFLAFDLDGGLTLVNSDCKKDYDWAVHPLPGMLGLYDSKRLDAQELLDAQLHREFGRFNTFAVAVTGLLGIEKFETLQRDAIAAFETASFAIATKQTELFNNTVADLRRKLGYIVGKYRHSRDLPALLETIGRLDWLVERIGFSEAEDR